MLTREATCVPRELYAMQDLFHAVWGELRQRRDVTPRDAESLLEDIAERVFEFTERQMTEAQITEAVLASYGIRQEASLVTE